MQGALAHHHRWCTSAPYKIALLIWKWNDLLVRESIVRVNMLEVRVLQKRLAVIAVVRARRAPELSKAQPGVAKFCGGLCCHLSVVRHLSACYPLAEHAGRA